MENKFEYGIGKSDCTFAARIPDLLFAFHLQTQITYIVIISSFLNSHFSRPLQPIKFSCLDKQNFNASCQDAFIRDAPEAF